MAPNNNSLAKALLRCLATRAPQVPSDPKTTLPRILISTSGEICSCHSWVVTTGETQSDHLILLCASLSTSGSDALIQEDLISQGRLKREGNLRARLSDTRPCHGDTPSRHVSHDIISQTTLLTFTCQPHGRTVWLIPTVLERTLE